MGSPSSPFRSTDPTNIMAFRPNAVGRPDPKPQSPPLGECPEEKGGTHEARNRHMNMKYSKPAGYHTVAI